MKLVTLTVAVLLTLFTSTALAAPKTLWSLEYYGKSTYSVHPHRAKKAARGSIAATKKSIEKIQRGEWLLEDDLTAVAPAGELTELLDHARARGAVLKPSWDVVTARAHVTGGTFDPKRVRITIENHSPYPITVRELWWVGCMSAQADLPRHGIRLAPNEKVTQTIALGDFFALGVPRDCAEDLSKGKDLRVVFQAT